MSGLTEHIITGIDLARTETKPTGWALWKTSYLHLPLNENNQILDHSLTLSSTLIAIDVSFSLPMKGSIRQANKESITMGILFSLHSSQHWKN